LVFPELNDQAVNKSFGQFNEDKVFVVDSTGQEAPAHQCSGFIFFAEP